ncbi:MAG TPA: hypothetical protein VFA41_05590 [Ktedonobacteraceae bacterium]|nr:hypothetical protein [Ktedonobacteraceae bacterium]
MQKRLLDISPLLSLCCCLCLVLLSACSTYDKPALNTSPGTTTTTCPSAGSARAAIVPPLSNSAHANLVYYTGDASDRSDVIERYDIVTHKVVPVTTVTGGVITYAQMSSDGQWVAFLIRVDTPHPHVELRLVRADGKFEQTVYCIPFPVYASPYESEVGQFTWSRDMKTIAVLGLSGQFQLPAIYIVDLTSGQAQLVLESALGKIQKTSYGSYPQELEAYFPVKWLDNTHLYVGSYKQRRSDLQPYQSDLYLLDITKGANQHSSDLQTVLTWGGPTTSGIVPCDFDSSPDGSQLYIAQCTRQNGAVQTSGIIVAMPATGGQQTTIFSTPSSGIVGLRVVDNQTLLLLTINHPGNGYTGDTLWKIHTDGSGLTRLASDNGGLITWCSYLENGCSTVSSDASQYGVVDAVGSSDNLWVIYGSLTGGMWHQAAQMQSLYQGFIGWAKV